ncbi:hypothetical protein PN36_10410 [Candidatus Thiomargarita nelsonii]|uniref:Uncharacterized protein n=1 Tax=Candidatus Thiomargarita nelsonii TaxID=1003181 RepID=A0A4E0QR97_9GAMM|nr:hypothetical protein PN36_10410 [Candidatus Thiomargarita nelsonii]
MDCLSILDNSLNIIKDNLRLFVEGLNLNVGEGTIVYADIIYSLNNIIEMNKSRHNQSWVLTYPFLNVIPTVLRF